MNLLDLTAVLKLDSSGYEAGIGRAASIIKTLGVGVGVAIGTASTAVAGLTSSVVNAYGEYEQLVGGVETLFGAGGQSLEQYAESMNLTVDEVRDQYDSLMTAQSAMMENAANAFMTAGMSANEYMSTVTSFSASLIQGLGGDTEAAAVLADQAIQDMSDNANKMGTDIEMIQNAYQGFARGNYTMLDNLKLGYGGTASEMIRLINDSGILEEEISSIDEVSFDQMISAIHVIQDNMGITGTTADEAGRTIQGSLGSLSAAWQNLITGLGDSDADLEPLINNVVTTAMTAVNNLMPVVQQAMNGIANLVTQLAPVLESELPTLISTILPPLLSAVSAIITAVADALPQIAGVLLPQIPPIIQRVVPVIMSLVPAMISIGSEIVGALVTGLVQNAGAIVDAGLGAIQELINAFNKSVNGDGLNELMGVAFSIVQSLGGFLVQNLPTLIGSITELLVQVVTFIAEPSNQEMLIELGFQLITAVADGLVQAMPAIASLIPTLIASNIQVAVTEFPKILEVIGSLVGDLGMLIIGLVAGFMGKSYDDVVNSLTLIGDYLSQSFSDFVNGVVVLATNIGDNVVEMWSSISNNFTTGITTVGGVLSGWWEDLQSWFGNLVDNALTWGSDLIDNFISGITGGIGAVGDAVSNIASTVRNYIGFSEPERGPLSNFHTYAPDMIELFTDGIEDSLPMLGSALDSMSSFVYNGMPNPVYDTAEYGNNRLNQVSDQPTVIQLFIGSEKIDEIIYNASQTSNFVAGGRG